MMAPAYGFGLAVVRFFAPVALLLAGFETLLWRVGESWPVSRVVRVQQAQPEAIFLRQFLDQAFYRYKYLNWSRERPSVLVLGSSRVMSFRAPMFGRDSAAFYNAGGMIQSLDDLDSFVNRLQPGETPRVVLLGIDMWWLNGNWPSHDRLTPGIEKDGAAQWQDHVIALRHFITHPKEAVSFLRHGIRASNTRLRIGIAARFREAGFRTDGSFIRNHPLPRNAEQWRFVDREHPTVGERIRAGEKQFVPSEGIDPSRVATLKRIVTQLQSSGALVIGYIPPVATVYARVLEADSRFSGLWKEYVMMIPALLADLGIPYVNAAVPTLVGADDHYLSDGVHTEETFALLVIRKALEDPRVAAAIQISASVVDSILASPRTNYWYPDFGAMQWLATTADSFEHREVSPRVIKRSTAATPGRRARIATLK
jgi:hypothetical protein